MIYNMLCKCPARAIDQYVDQRIKLCDEAADITIDSRLECIVERMFQRCFDDAKYKQVKLKIFIDINNLLL